jgi:hypothetical protein
MTSRDNMCPHLESRHFSVHSQQVPKVSLHLTTAQSCPTLGGQTSLRLPCIPTGSTAVASSLQSCSCGQMRVDICLSRRI